MHNNESSSDGSSQITHTLSNDAEYGDRGHEQHKVVELNKSTMISHIAAIDYYNLRHFESRRSLLPQYGPGQISDEGLVDLTAVLCQYECRKDMTPFHTMFCQVRKRLRFSFCGFHSIGNYVEREG